MQEAFSVVRFAVSAKRGESLEKAAVGREKSSPYSEYFLKKTAELILCRNRFIYLCK